MNTNIEISNIYKHFFLYTEQNNNDVFANKAKYNTRLVPYCFHSINEANISNQIKNIPYYSNNYDIVEDYDFINICQLNEKYIEKLDLNHKKKYLVFQYKSNKFIHFNDFLFSIRNPKFFILNTIESFKYILKGFIQLNENNICFFNLSPKSIAFNLDCGDKPIIQHFQHSILVSKLNESYITNIINNIDDFTHKPLEIHILFYIIKNEISTISYIFIEEICDKFIKNLTVLQLFPYHYTDSYKASCIEYLQKYINKPKSYIIHDILQQHDKWDVYSLSLLYLHIFGNISRVFCLKRPFLNKLLAELFKNISPNPSKRSSLQQLLKQFDSFLHDENDWSFVNKLSFNALLKLFDILEK
jgi:hypothetical protein